MIFNTKKYSQNMKNILKISSGTLLGQAISIISLPILTRIYGPSVIGVWAFIISLSTMINSLSDLGLINSIMIEKEEKNCQILYTVISTISLVFSFLIGIFSFLYFQFIVADSLYTPLMVGIFLFVMVFTMQQQQICYTWLNRQGKYDILMKNPIINNLSLFIIALFLGVIGFKLYGYFIGACISQILTVTHMKRFLPKKTFTISPYKFKYVFASYKSLIKYQLPTNFVIQLKNQLPIFFISIFFGNTILGYYSITQRILGIPINLLANSIGKVFFKNISEMSRKGIAIGKYTFENLNRAMKIAVIPISLLIGAGDILILIAFGPGYEMTGIMIKIVAYMYLFIFLNQCSSGLAITLGKQQYSLIQNIVQILGIIFSFIITIKCFNNIYIFLILNTFVFSISQIVYFTFLFKIMNYSWRKYLVAVSKLIINTTSIALSVYIVIYGIKLLL